MSTQMVRASFALEQDGDWIHITPPGPVIVPRDGRAPFMLRDPERVITASATPLLIDWEHDSEKWDGRTVAAGWCSELSSRPSGIWGRVSWTPEGARDTSTKAYRFLSPVLVLDGETRDVLELVSVALTNRPALSMSAVGDTAAYRARVRVACSQRGDHSVLSDSDRERFRRSGFSEGAIQGYEQRLRDERADPYHGLDAWTAGALRNVDALKAQRGIR